MAGQFGDSFDVYANANASTDPVVIAANQASLLRRWNTASSGATAPVTTNIGARHGSCLQLAAGRSLGKIFPHQNRWITGFALYLQDPLSTYTQRLITLNNCSFAGGTLISLFQTKINNDGTLTLFARTTAITTTSFSLAQNIWYYVEFDVSYTDTGTIQVTAEMHVSSNNGGTIIGTAGGAADSGVQSVALASQSATSNGLTLSSPGGSILVDDFYLLNALNGVNDTFLGDQVLGALHPAVDVTALWTPNATGSHASLVNENPEDQDTTYVSSVTPAQLDTYFYQNLPLGGVITFVQASTCLRKTDQGIKSLEAVVGSMGGEAQSQLFFASSNYNWYIYLLDQDPATPHIGWTVPGFNATPFGEQLVT